MTGKRKLLNAVNDIVMSFPSNTVCKRIANDDFSIENYRSFLLTLFHQTYEAPQMLSRAASGCPVGYETVREHLIEDAQRIKNGWRAVLFDLRAIGYDGPDPREFFPTPATQAYIAFNYYVAHKAPVARMAITTVMEAIMTNFGQNYSEKLFRMLDLKPEQATFMYRPGSKGTQDDIMRVIDESPMTDEDWSWMVHAARTGGTLYRTMYDTALDKA